jgi:hypothetical protein
MGLSAAFFWAKPKEAASKKVKILYFIGLFGLAKVKSCEQIKVRR